MAVTSARVQLNGTWHNLTKNSSTGLWEVTVAAPSVTSFNLAGGYYPLTVEASSSAGTKTTVNATDPNIGSQLRLVVKEKIAPVATITNPGDGAYIGSNTVNITATLRDETNGSGIEIDTLDFKFDGVNVAASVSKTQVSGGYDLTYNPGTLDDGPHTISIQVQDNDGNVSSVATASFTVDTIPPSLNITNPINNQIVAETTLNITGETNDATSSPVTVQVVLNNTPQPNAVVAADGTFSSSVTLSEGQNTLVITSIDRAGKSTEVTLTVVLDTTVPVIGDIVITPNPVDTDNSVIISVEVI